MDASCALGLLCSSFLANTRAILAALVQEKGLDTVDANRALGLPDDCREYSAGVCAAVRAKGLAWQP